MNLDIPCDNSLKVSSRFRSRFVCDVHLGKLAKYLRLLGFDTLFRDDYDDAELVAISLSDDRVLLSRDRELIATPDLTSAYRVREKFAKEQLLEVGQHFHLKSNVAPFTRCLICNGRLLEISHGDLSVGSVPKSVYTTHDLFLRCEDCQRIYWKGSHHKRMEHFIEDVLAVMEF